MLCVPRSARQHGTFWRFVPLPASSTFCRSPTINVAASRYEGPAKDRQWTTKTWLPAPGWSSFASGWPHTFVCTHCSCCDCCAHHTCASPAVPLPPQGVHSAAARALPHRQERISSDGAWWSSALPTGSSSSSSSQQPYVIGSATPAGVDTAPAVPLVSAETIDRLADLVQAARGTLVLTGAGCSTESGVPDYRGPAGAYTTSNFKPMTHQQASRRGGAPTLPPTHAEGM